MTSRRFGAWTAGWEAKFRPSCGRSAAIGRTSSTWKDVACHHWWTACGEPVRL